MISSKYLGIMAVLVAVGAIGLCPKPAPAAESVPGDKSLIGNQGASSDAAGDSDAEPHVPRSPLRLNEIDYKDAGNGAGKLTVAGIALPGKELYLFLDDQPLAKAVPDDGGQWSIESQMTLDTGRHTLRADQYDTDTNMLAARATVSIERAKPGSEDAPAESSPPKAATP
jgi:hypothetical protein